MDIEKIGLKETLEALRTELAELASSTLFAEGKEIRFEVGEIELEIQFVVEKEKGVKGGVKGGIKFWVVDIGGGEIGGGLSEKNATVQKLKIPLKPKWSSNDKPLEVGRKEENLDGWDDDK